MVTFLETSLPLTGFVAVYLAFRIKHLTADYFLQTSWMAHGKTAGSDWVFPLLGHAAVHAAGTLLIALVFAPALWWLGPLDLLIHAMIDRAKAFPACGAGRQPDEAAFWWCHGVDQEAHNLTHLAFVIAIVLA
jgi:hypothetical protein